MINSINKIWVEKLAERLGPPIFTLGDEVRFNCFRSECGHTSTSDNDYHMYVNPAKGKYFCQRCQRGGTIDYLCEFLGLPLPEDNLSAWSEVMNTFLFGKPDEVVENTSVPEPDMVALVPGTRALRYLESRGIGFTRTRYFNVSLGIRSLRNRVVFPDYTACGTLTYWVARDYVGRKPKYRNPKSPKCGKVYSTGRWLSSVHETVVICEGVISAVITGFNAVATYGKYVTKEQVASLRELSAKEYVVAFDGDALEYGVSLASRLRRLGCLTKVVRLPKDKDPADIGYDGMTKYVQDAVEIKNDFDAVGLLL